MPRCAYILKKGNFIFYSIIRHGHKLWWKHIHQINPISSAALRLWMETANITLFRVFVQVLHKAVIEVDEKGTTAASATSVGITAYSLPATFIVNRPFFFFLYHEATSSLLFMGRVIDPTKNWQTLAALERFPLKHSVCLTLRSMFLMKQYFRYKHYQIKIAQILRSSIIMSDWQSRSTVCICT